MLYWCDYNFLVHIITVKFSFIHCRREKPLLLSEADSDTDDPQIPLEQTFPEHVPTTSGEPFVYVDIHSFLICYVWSFKINCFV